MNDAKVIFAMPDKKEEKINKEITKKLYGKQRPNHDLKNDFVPVPWAVCAESTLQMFSIIPAIYAFCVKFIAGGFIAGLDAATEVFTERKRKRKINI